MLSVYSVQFVLITKTDVQEIWNNGTLVGKTYE